MIEKLIAPKYGEQIQEGLMFKEFLEKINELVDLMNEQQNGISELEQKVKKLMFVHYKG